MNWITKIGLALLAVIIALLAFIITKNSLGVDRDMVYDETYEYHGIIRDVYENSQKTHTGNVQVDSSKYELLTNVFGGLGVGLQSVNADFETKERASVILKSCIKKAMMPESVFYDSLAWDQSPLEAIDSANHHLAYFGYFNLLLSMNRYIESIGGTSTDGRKITVNDEFTKLSDRITGKLMDAFIQSDCGMLQTYPSQAITTDNAAAIGSIALYYKALGKDYPEKFRKIIENFKKLGIDKKTGLLNYYIDYKTGENDGTLRGSGTAVAMYCMSFADTSITKTLYSGLIKHLKDAVYGVQGIREYLRDGEDPPMQGDTDTGPIVYGIGMTSTGFTIAGTLLFKDRKTFDDLSKTAWTFGAPSKTSGGKFTRGDITQNAIMLAILNAKFLHDSRNYKSQ